MHFTPLYEAGRIQDIIAEFEQLIEHATEEEPYNGPRKLDHGISKLWERAGLQWEE
jgi:hypothetical protein